MQHEIAQLKAVSNLRNLADNYFFTSKPVEPAEVAAVLRQQADVMEQEILYRA